MEPGAICTGPDRIRFAVWAPRCREVAVRVLNGGGHTPTALTGTADGWFQVTLPGLGPGTKYLYVLDQERERPDPMSRAQPEGVHGPSEVVDTRAFAWSDAGWHGLPLRDMVTYEVHVGTFTPEGTFEAIIPRLPALRSLGVTAIELMPVASFPGSRNWGYDGVGLFAPQATYGGPVGLQRLVDACHGAGLAVILDAVYNHLGPEGNYLADFGPYSTDRYATPWGAAVNYDGEGARGVRDFVVANALYWIREYHIDALRLDAVHGIFDRGPLHILEELNAAVQWLARRLGRTVPVIAESDLNDRRLLDPVDKGGYGLAGQWLDDFHHCVHTLVTGEQHGYYQDFGLPSQLVKAYTDGFVYDGQHSPYRGRPHGTPSAGIAAERLVVCVQNHDQVGNRALGERLSTLVDFDRQKLAASALLISPYAPLLFMGEEYGERAPFLFFTDFGDPDLQAAVTRGRRQEFADFEWMIEPPDPQEPASYARSKLDWGLRTQPPHAWLLEYYRALLDIRRRHPVLGTGGKRRMTVRVDDRRVVMVTRRRAGGAAALGLLNFGANPVTVRPTLSPGRWRRLIDSAEERFGGFGSTTPPLLQVSRAGQAAVKLPSYGATIYLRERTAEAEGSGCAEKAAA